MCGEYIQRMEGYMWVREREWECVCMSVCIFGLHFALPLDSFSSASTCLEFIVQNYHFFPIIFLVTCFSQNYRSTCEKVVSWLHILFPLEYSVNFLVLICAAWIFYCNKDNLLRILCENRQMSKNVILCLWHIFLWLLTH